MAVRTYGIFLAYSPLAKLRSEGLGRYLAAFVKAASQGDVVLVVAAPSWSRRPLRDLFAEAGVRMSQVQFVGPTREPISLTLYHLLERIRRPRWRPGRNWLRRAAAAAKAHFDALVRTLVGTRNLAVFLALTAYLGLLALVSLPVVAVLAIVVVARNSANWALRGASARLSRPLGRRMGRLRNELKDKAHLRRRLYDGLLAKEMQILVASANRLDHVSAWYAPTSTLPTFNEIRAPKLMAFPDLVFREFPIAFAEYGVGAHIIARKVRETVAGGQHFVTYSERIKRTVLVEHMGVPAGQVRVVPHAPSTLDEHITIQGFLDNDAASESLCRSLAGQALGRLTGPARGLRFKEARFDFLFYASQFRPSKNVITLLRAYEHLLKRRYIGHKLVLTGLGDYPEVSEFITRHRLERDVLCVTNLSEPELAAFYRLADLAVNPSLSEGGMPFTFTEALSVGTPAVMGDIEVTREVMVDPELREATLFDPYDWRAMARKIEWALANRATLYARQRAFYDEVLAARSWENVVAEHIRVLDEIAAPPAPAEAPAA